MRSPDRRWLRVVPQHVFRERQASYRLIAYGDRATYPPSDFESLAQLKKALRSVWPDFDENSLAIRKDALDTNIVFSRDVELEESELSTLGLKNGAKVMRPDH